MDGKRNLIANWILARPLANQMIYYHLKNRGGGAQKKPKVDTNNMASVSRCIDEVILQKAATSHQGSPRPRINTRTSSVSRGWDAAVGVAIHIMPSSKLPTKRIILSRYRAMREEDINGTTSHMVTKIADELLHIWAMSPRIPVLSVGTVQQKVSLLIKDHLNKAPASRRLHPEYQNSLDRLFNICAISRDE